MIREKVKQAIDRYGLFQKNDRVLIACSGGGDSVGLVHILVSLQPEWSLQLYVGHFDHSLRPESNEDAEFVRRLADKYSLPFCQDSQDVALWAREKRLNLEEAGRELRYQFLKTAAQELGCSKIATGHTMTDQAETFFMRLIRGSGMRGLAGIFPIMQGIIVRPLIQVEGEEIEAYLQENKLKFRVDRTNFDKRFLRNRVRLEILPFMRDRFDANIVAHIGQLTDLLQEENELLDNLALEKSESVIVGEGKEAQLDFQNLSLLPLALQRRIVRIFISKLKGDLRGISYQDVESILKMGEGKKFHLKKDLFLQKKGGLVSLQEKLRSQVVYEYVWDGRGEFFIQELALRFEGKIISRKNISSLCCDNEALAHLDADKLHFPLTVRSRRQGDRYRPLGAPGRQKLKEIMRAKDISAADRDRHPVFLSGEEIVWVQGLPVAEKFKVTDATTAVFEIKKVNP